MTASGYTGSDFFRLWLEGNRTLLDGTGGPLWQQAERIFAAWQGFADAFAGAHAARHGGGGSSPFDPAGWLRPEGGGGMADLFRWLEGPELPGPGTEHARAMQGTREWLAYLTATEQMKAVLAEGWIAAFRAFVERTAAEDRAATAAGTAAPGWDRMQAIWQEAAGAELARTYRRPAFLSASRDLLAAETALRRSLRERIERVADELGLPTRAEIDDLHAALHRLDRRLRRMQAAPGADAEPKRR